MPELNFIKQVQVITPADKSTEEYVGKLKTGDVIRGEFSKARNPGFHRKMFALLNFAFDHCEYDSKEYKGVKVEPNFDRFREDLTILCGYYTATFDINGEVKLKAKSISYAKMDIEDFEKLYNKMITVILKKVLVNYSKEEIDSTINSLMSFA